MKKARLVVTKSTPTGLNTEFKDTKTGEILTRGQVVKRIEQGKYPNYHVATIEINGRKYKIPRSNPDKSTDNNLG